MSLFKAFKGNRAALDTVEKHSGYVYFCVDDGSLFFDYTDAEGNLQRKQINAKEAESLVGFNPSDYLAIDQLDNAITSALTQAKESGEFNGVDGEDGAQGPRGHSIVASVARTFTNAQWNTYGTIGHVENWASTSCDGVSVGDLFFVTGLASDTGAGHIMVYQHTAEKNNCQLNGKCIAHHVISAKGATGATGATGKSAYEYAVDSGYAGSEDDFAADSNPDNLVARVLEALPNAEEVGF